MSDTVRDLNGLVVTARAVAEINALLSAEPDAEDLALWVQITGVNGSDFAYDLAFESFENAAANDLTREFDGLRLVVPAASIDALNGATLDLPDDENQGGLVLRNPNKPDPLDGIDLTREGDLADKVQVVLEKMVNPMLAQHGGFAELEGVQGTRVFLRMGGGCHGCSISWLTLKSGITKTITETLPEVTEVVDVTDHESGTNPYYTSAQGAATVSSS